MAYADTIRSAAPTWEAVATLIEGIGVSGYPLTWTEWTSTIGGGGDLTWTATSRTSKYIRIGKLVFCIVTFVGNLGGSATNLLTATLPATAATNSINPSSAIGLTLNTTYQSGLIKIGYTNPTIAQFFKSDATNYPTTSTAKVDALFFYEAE